MRAIVDRIETTLPHGWRDFWLQFLVFWTFNLSYEATRGLSDGARAAAFKNGMRRLASGVCVVTTKLTNGPVGLLSTSVTSVSADPPVLLFCVNKSTSSHDAFLSSKSFCVNVLEEADQVVATRFGSPDFRHVRFEDRDWQKLATGSPALKGCSVSFDCEVISQIAVSTHTIFLGHVLDIAQWTESCSPLLYWDGEYHPVANERRG